MSLPYEKYLQEILIDSETLQARIRELGRQISDEYTDEQDLLLICVLKGGVMFLTDLMRISRFRTALILWRSPAMAAALVSPRAESELTWT